MSNFDSFIESLTEEQKKALIQALNKNSNDAKIIPDSTRVSAPESETFTMNKTEKTNRRREPVRARKNEWRDEGEFRDVETPDFEKTPRTRKPHKKVDVECSVCGRSFKTDPKYVYGEYHRCNRCTGR